MQGGGIAPSTIAPPQMNQQHQMHPSPQAVPSQWGVVPPPAPQPQYPPTQAPQYPPTQAPQYPQTQAPQYPPTQGQQYPQRRHRNTLRPRGSRCGISSPRRSLHLNTCLLRSNISPSTVHPCLHLFSGPIQNAQPQPSSADEVRTLWIGDLQYWMEESYIHNCFAHTGEVVSVKLIRNKQTGQFEGYGFVEFATRATAERVLQTYNGTMMPNGEQAFSIELGWWKERR
ncbi:hypothetical protein HPP92_005556 [Vanilla planifolia]|uniref:RRM domain-containing protein n=1 Tax=Vanilla planifolia TaxID=51239 RepID=A0A835RYW6_VANPL|nr:hypothetical protein HPP92_005556 [Vanilla planifolia]